MQDTLFGELEYDYGWIGKSSIRFFDKNVNVSVYIQSADESDEITAEQRQAYISFIKDLPMHQSAILDRIYEYYLSIFECLYDSTPQELPISLEEFKNTIAPESIIVGYQDIRNEIAMTFQCTWDEDNGVGMLLYDMNIDDVGYRNIAF